MGEFEANALLAPRERATSASRGATLAKFMVAKACLVKGGGLFIAAESFNIFENTK